MNIQYFTVMGGIETGGNDLLQVLSTLEVFFMKMKISRSTVQISINEIMLLLSLLMYSSCVCEN